MRPTISFITVVRNNADGLRRTLKNLSSLSYDSKELIVIDGVSTDGTLDVVSEYAEHINYFVSEPDSGIYDAMNKAIGAATGKFLWFVNAGDRVRGIEELKCFFATDSPLSDIYYGDTMIVAQSGQELGLRRKPLPRKLSLESLKNGMVICHQSFIVRRSITPLYDTSYKFSADYNWMIECVRRSKSSTNLGFVISEFELGGATTKNHKASLRERFAIMRNNFGFITTVLYHIKFIFDGIFKSKYR